MQNILYVGFKWPTVRNYCVNRMHLTGGIYDRPLALADKPDGGDGIYRDRDRTLNLKTGEGLLLYCGPLLLR